MTNTFFVGVYPGLDAVQLDRVADVFTRFMRGDRRTNSVIRLTSQA